MQRFLFTLKAWPVIALATIGLCYLTQTVASWLGVTLPDQANVELVSRCLTNAFASAKHFLTAALLVAQVLVLAPALEELVFRGLLFRLPCRLVWKGRKPDVRCLWTIAAVSSALFSSAHYVFQPWPDAAFLALFFFGLAQCRVYRKTGRIWCAMLDHFLFNLTNLVLMFVLPEAAT